MPDILVRDLESEAVERLKRRAAESGRSLQAEAKLVLELASRSGREDVAKRAAVLRRRLASRKQTDSVQLIREDRRR